MLGTQGITYLPFFIFPFSICSKISFFFLLFSSLIPFFRFLLPLSFGMKYWICFLDMITCLLKILTKLKNACATLMFSRALVSTIGTFWTLAKYIISSKYRDFPLSHLVATNTTGTSMRSKSSKMNLYWVPGALS